MTATESLPPSQPAFSDQRTGLIIFGVLEILIGCFCVLMVALMFVGLSLGKVTGASSDSDTIIFGALMYAAIAIMFVWLGIGSIMCRRWARALLLILSWGWLLMGIVMMGIFVTVQPRIAEATQPGPGSAAITITLVIFAVIFLVIPSTLTLFYQGRNVKATCEARDPVRRWTDACPLPVLAASLWIGMGALFMLPTSLTDKDVLPFFGILLTGLPATLSFVAWSAGSVWLAWAFYRLKPFAWWVAVVACVLFVVSYTITFARIDPMEIYRQMGHAQQHLDQIQKYNFCSGKSVAIWMTCCTLPWFGYLLWIKKFFRRSA
ncbi:MAG: hypothetical protein WA117_11360 [Verrucomicrobiia bacterium]